MDANQLFKTGQLDEAIAAQLAVVKNKPLDHGQRLFLFEMLAFAGDLDRAQKQIEAINYGQPDLDAAVIDYRKLVTSERVRRQVFTQKVQPEFIVQPPDHVKQRLLGLGKLVDGAAAEAAQIFSAANAQIPPIKGTLNGKAFESIRDGDDCLGSVLEVFTGARYFWVPLEQVASVTMNAPRFPRDLLWIPAHLEIKEGEAGPVFLPTLYPGTYQEPDTQLKLGRLTDWRGAGLVRGVGLKVFFVGPEEAGILDFRKLELSGSD
jgi:type VI secretion system protein ImpE